MHIVTIKTQCNFVNQEGGMPSLLSPSLITWFCPSPTSSSLPTRRSDSKRQTINTKAIVNPNRKQIKWMYKILIKMDIPEQGSMIGR